MDPNQTEKLKALALAATKRRSVSEEIASLYDFQGAANPAAVLELIAEVERLRAAPAAGTVNKDAARFQLAIALEDNAEFLYAAVLNHAPDATAIRSDFDAAMAHTKGKDTA